VIADGDRAPCRHESAAGAVCAESSREQTAERLKQVMEGRDESFDAQTPLSTKVDFSNIVAHEENCCNENLSYEGCFWY
jgi:hypothetical protein